MKWDDIDLDLLAFVRESVSEEPEPAGLPMPEELLRNREEWAKALILSKDASEQRKEVETEQPEIFKKVRHSRGDIDPTAPDLAEKRARALVWVDSYTVTAAASMLSCASVPGASSGILCTLEAVMCYEIGKIYRPNWTTGDAATTASVIGLAAVAGRLVAFEAAVFAGPFALPIKSAIAAGIVKTVGQLVIEHFEAAS